jgi:hypothetical protein
MIEVEQTEFADYNAVPIRRGNCLAACVASIFEVPLSDLQEVYDSQTLWAWLRGYAPAVGMIARTYDEAVLFGSRVPTGFTGLPGLTPWIAVVQSPRTPHAHCVVMVGETLVWDPHPQREMGVGPQLGDYAFTLDRPEMLHIRNI